MRDISTPAQHEFAARAELFIDALGATLDGLTDDAGAVQPSIRRIGQVVAEAARDAGIFDIEAMAVELAASAYIQRSHILELIDLIESTISDRPPRRSILVVEDDDISAMVLHAIGHETHSAATVASTMAEAREALTGWIPDLIVMDLFLPDGDGRSFLAELRSDPRLSQIPVIIISGFDHDLARAESLALGADRFISKPFEPEELMEIFNGIKPHSRRVSSALVTRGLLLREFSAGVGDQTVAMIRFHPVLGVEHPLPAQALPPAAEALALSLTGHGLVAEWSDGLFCAVIDRPIDRSQQLLDDVRRRLRNESTSGGTTTFTAGLIEATGQGFMRAVGSANGLLQRGESDGGDRITRKVVASRPSVVLAEDDTLIAALVSGRLEARGFEVDVITDGLAAIDRISQTCPSLVLLDLFLPGADGFDVLRKLKGNEATADIPVIILTGADGESSVVKAFELGASDYVVKPFSPAELMVRIERFFR